MGCDALDDKGEPVCRCGFWTIKDDENHICYLYTMREEDGQAAYLEIQKNDITMEQIKNSLDVTMELNYGGKGMTIRYIDPEKDCVEGRGNESDQGHEE